MVMASPADHLLIEAAVEQMTQAEQDDRAPKLVVYTLPDPVSYATTRGLREAFPGASISSGTDPRQLIVIFELDLDPVDQISTRLITRIRMQYQWLRPAIVFDLLVEFGDVVMMRKCMLGIKERAEALAGYPLESP